MTRLRKLGRGFTLIELMIVVSIIGIMTAICVPSFMRFECRAKQSEAKEVMKAMWLTNEAYNGEYASYITVPEMIAYGGLDASTVNGRYYSYTVTLSLPNYTLTALDAQGGKLAVSSQGPGDQWWMSDLDARPTNIVDRCMF